MKRVKIYGAGSIGNHLANAARKLGWEVAICDRDKNALDRTKNQIYPSRYGAWDDGISLHVAGDEPRGDFDLIMIGTPPESHLPLLADAIKEKPLAIQVEKPVCTPDMETADSVFQAAFDARIPVFTGYDHVVGKAVLLAEQLLNDSLIGSIETLDVEFREHWAGIFAAHDWLQGPSDTYLGYTSKGGGASGEHSHALNLWQHLAHVTGAGRVTAVDARIRMQEKDGARYDDLASLHLETESGLIGRVIQDVVTLPSRKWTRIQGENGAVEILINGAPNGDLVVHRRPNEEPAEHMIEKTRPDDFIQELKHIESCVENGTESPISLERGLETMLVLAAAHRSESEQRRVSIDYSQGFTFNALS